MKYRCDNDRCGTERSSHTDLAVYGTCKECRCGWMRRVRSTPAATDEAARGATAKEKG